MQAKNSVEDKTSAHFVPTENMRQINVKSSRNNACAATDRYDTGPSYVNEDR